MKKLFLTILYLAIAVPSFAQTVLQTAINNTPVGGFYQIPSASMNNFNDGVLFSGSGRGGGCGIGDWSTQYANRAVWNPIDNRFQFAGGPHGTCTISITTYYDEATNTWGNFAQSGAQQHAYDHNAINWTTGVHYYRQYQQASIAAIPNTGSSWAMISPSIPSSSFQCCGALEWFPNMNKLVWIDGDWGGWAWAPGSPGSWTHLFRTNGNDGSGLPQYPMVSYLNWSVYSSTGVLVFGGNSNVYKMNSAGVVTTLTNAPFAIKTGTGGGPGSCCSVSADPVSGRVIVIRNDRHIWELDPGGTNPANTGTWTDTGVLAPAFFTQGTGTGTGEGLISAQMPNRGVIFYVKCEVSSTCGVFLYRHAASAPDTTPPSAVSGLQVSVISSSQLNLTWTAATDNIAVTGYNVERCTGAACSPTVQVYLPTSNSQNDTGLSTNTTYGYRVRAHDAAGNLGAYSSTVYGTTATGDVTAPTVPGSPQLAVISASQIDLSWTASTDAVGVTGYNVFRCQGAACSPTVQVYTPSGTTQSDTGLVSSTLYRYCIKAHDLAGNLSACSTIVEGTTSAQSGSDFATRCAAAGVLTCFGFDTTADLNPSFGGADGARGQLYGRFPGSGTPNYTDIGIDTSQKVTGAGSLFIRVPGSGSNNVTWFTNLSSTNIAEQLQPGQTVYIQMRYRVDTNFFSQNYSGSSGFKLFDLSGGDTAGCAGASPKTSYNCPTTCWQGETVFTTTLNSQPGRHLLTGYNNCVPPDSFLGWYGFTSNITWQTAVNCLYDGNGALNAIAPPCVYLTPNEWWTIKMRLTIGTYNTNSSTVQVWLGKQGQPTQLVHECGPTPLLTCNGRTTGIRINRDTVDSVQNQTNPAVVVGKLWLETYQTGASWGGLQDGYAWFDDLIISRNDIADPVDGPPAGDVTAPSVPANLTVTALDQDSIDVAWGTSTDDTAVAGYNLERCAGIGCSNFAEIISQAGTHYIDTGLTGSTFHTYRVRARDAVPNYSSYSGAMTATTLGPSFTSGTVSVEGKGSIQ